ncbi:hypothetical protein GUITHDRAFT_64925, partial [Guillardia theta CCMP2712]
QQVEFVKGAVSMETLPPDELPEACFAGRSNVGKSSLVNMICNRKKLAFTSKTPGKTQSREPHIRRHGPVHLFASLNSLLLLRFHLVDLPGVGYAEVPKAKKVEWLRFYRDYLSHRKSLRIFFQLVDGRHGPLQDDVELMKLFAESSSKNPNQVAHAIVITKMDKTLSAKVLALFLLLPALPDSAGQAQEGVMDKVRRTLSEAGCDEETPVLLTSSASKLGRGDVWNYLQLALQDGIEVPCILYTKTKFD